MDGVFLLGCDGNWPVISKMKVLQACGCAHSSCTVVVSLILVSVISSEVGGTFCARAQQ